MLPSADEPIAKGYARIVRPFRVVGPGKQAKLIRKAEAPRETPWFLRLEVAKQAAFPRDLAA